MKSPAIRSVIDIVTNSSVIQCGKTDGSYVPARSTGYHSFFYRLKATWLVFTGQADAVTWPGQ